MGLIKFDGEPLDFICQEVLKNIGTQNKSTKKFYIDYRSPYNQKLHKKISILLHFDKNGVDKNVVSALAYVEKITYNYFLFKVNKISLGINIHNLTKEIIDIGNLYDGESLAHEIVRNTMIHELMHVEQYINFHEKTHYKIYSRNNFIIKLNKLKEEMDVFFLKRAEFDPIIKTLVCDMIRLHEESKIEKKYILNLTINEYLLETENENNLLKITKKYDKRIYKKALKKLYLEFIG